MDIRFVRLTEIDPALIAAHMNDPRMAAHMPLLKAAVWDEATVAAFVAGKEACWTRDGLGHTAILADGAYVGWGGFQKEGEDWDFGLVLTAPAFGLGVRIAREALAVARRDPRIESVTFLLAPSRRSLRALERMGAVAEGEVEHDGARFLKYRLATPAS